MTTCHSKIYSKSEINLTLNCHSNQGGRWRERGGEGGRQREKGREREGDWRIEERKGRLKDRGDEREIGG